MEDKVTEEITVLGVQFLTPARVTAEENGTKVVHAISVDLLNRKVYDKSMTESKDLGELIFNYLDSEMSLPDDFFAAGEDIQEKAKEAYDNIQKNRDAHLGDLGDIDGR